MVVAVPPGALDPPPPEPPELDDPHPATPSPAPASASTDSQVPAVCTLIMILSLLGLLVRPRSSRPGHVPELCRKDKEILLRLASGHICKSGPILLDIRAVANS